MELWSYGAMELRCKLLIELNLIKFKYLCQFILNVCGGYMGLTSSTVTRSSEKYIFVSDDPVPSMWYPLLG